MLIEDLSFLDALFMTTITITTVGYGDIAPATVAGKFIASLAMLTGYSIIAVPTGIFTMEIGKFAGKRKNGEDTRQCPACNHATRDKEDKFCSRCGTKLE